MLLDRLPRVVEDVVVIVPRAGRGQVIVVEEVRVVICARDLLLVRGGVALRLGPLLARPVRFVDFSFGQIVLRAPGRLANASCTATVCPRPSRTHARLWLQE